MSRILFILSAILLGGLMTCRADTLQSLWAPLGKEVEAFDSMMERAAFVDMPKRDFKAIASRLYVPANTSDPRQARARVCFWKGWVTVKDDPASALQLAHQAIALCDSARYPYDHSRFLLLKADCFRYNGSFADAYFLYRDNIQYFGYFLRIC